MVVCGVQKAWQGGTWGKMEVPRYVGTSCCTVLMTAVAIDVVDIVVVRLGDINYIRPECSYLSRQCYGTEVLLSLLCIFVYNWMVWYSCSSGQLLGSSRAGAIALGLGMALGG